MHWKLSVGGSAHRYANDNDYNFGLVPQTLKKFIRALLSQLSVYTFQKQISAVIYSFVPETYIYLLL